MNSMILSRVLLRSKLPIRYARITSIQTLSTLSGQNQCTLQGYSPSILRKRSFSTPSLAQLVKKLRASTGAPMVECKKALTAEEVNGDLEKALQWLRQHGSAKITNKMKAGGRDATEGLVGMIVLEHQGAALVKVGSETDFASRSEVFTTLVEDLAYAALKSQSESDANEGFFEIDVAEDSSFWNVTFPRGEGDNSTASNEMSVKQAMEEAILSIRENLQMKEVHCLLSNGDDTVVSGYIHGKTLHSQNAGTSAALIELQKSASNDMSVKDIKEIGKKLTMHIIAAKPDYLSPDHVPSDIVEKEKRMILQEVSFFFFFSKFCVPVSIVSTIGMLILTHHGCLEMPDWRHRKAR